MLLIITVGYQSVFCCCEVSLLINFEHPAWQMGHIYHVVVLAMVLVHCYLHSIFWKFSLATLDVWQIR